MIKVLKEGLVEETLLVTQEASEHVTNGVPDFCDGVLQSIQDELDTIVFDHVMTTPLTMLSSCGWRVCCVCVVSVCVVRVCRSCVSVGVCGGVCVHSQFKFKIRHLKDFHFYSFFKKRIVGPEKGPAKH